MQTIRLLDYYGNFPNFNFSQIRSSGGGHQISFFSQIQNSPHYPRGGGGQESYGFFPNFGTFLIMRAPLSSYGSSGPGRGKSWKNVTFRLKVRGCYGQRKVKIHTLSSPTVQSWLVEYQNIEFQVLGVIQGAHRTPKIGCFFKMFKIQLFCCFITQLVKKLHQWSLHEVIEDILLFVLNTKRPLSDIWLLSYEQNSFGCIMKKLKFLINLKTPKTVLYSNRTTGYPLSPHIMSVAVSFLQAQ